MKINQERVDKIGADLERKYLWWFLKNLKVFGEENLKGINEKRILYLPNHLSHFDYVIIPYILNRNRIRHPAIIAGKNLDHWPANELISEETGAVFVDRKNIMKRYIGERERKKLKRNIEEIVSEERDLMIFIEGGRVHKNGEIMKNPKSGYTKNYFHEIKRQNKNLDDYYAVNIAVNYEPYTIEKPFSDAIRFFKEKFFPLYFGLDVFAILSQPFRAKPIAHVNFGEPYPLGEFIKKQDYKGLIDFAAGDVRRLYEEISLEQI